MAFENLPGILYGAPFPRRKYIAKPGEWFDEGTEAIPVTEFWDTYDEDGKLCPSAVFKGIRNEKEDEETCGLDEFEIVEEE